MRGLATVVALQTVAIVVLAVFTFRASDSAPSPESPTVVFDEARLRDIIRQELARHAHAPPQPDATAANEPATPLGRAADLDQREFVEHQLAYYVNVGELSRSELAALELEISKLAPEDRREMLLRLSRAVNLGQIKPQL